MNYKILTDQPHSESDILTEQPIKLMIKEQSFLMDLLSFRDFCKFERGVKALGLRAIYPEIENSDKAISEVVKQEAELNKLSIQFDPGLGLAYFIASYLQPEYPTEFRSTAENWLVTHPEYGEISCDQDIGMRGLVADWIYCNLNIEEAFTLFRTLSELVSKIKKKSNGNIKRGSNYSGDKNGAATLCHSAHTAGISPEEALTKKNYLFVLTMIDEMSYQNEQEAKAISRKTDRSTPFTKGGRVVQYGRQAVND